MGLSLNLTNYLRLIKRAGDILASPIGASLVEVNSRQKCRADHRSKETIQSINIMDPQNINPTNTKNVA
jgi:hypothetical protein